MNEKHLAIFLMGLMLLGTGCAAPAAGLDQANQTGRQGYLDALKTWTRDAKVYDLFDTELIVTATWFCKPYRDALRAEQARAEALVPEEITRRVRKDEADLKSSVRFLVSAYTPINSWNDLAGTSPSFRLWLIDAKGRQVAPLSIKEVKLPPGGSEKYWPYLNEWSKTYEVLFPTSVEKGTALALTGGPVVLLAAGPRGKAKLEWQVP